MKNKLALKEHDVVEAIIAEVKSTILFNFLKDIHDYDGRFDAMNIIIKIEDVISHISEAKINEQFTEDMIYEMQTMKHK